MVIVNSLVINGISAFDEIDPTFKGRDDIGACPDLSPTDYVIARSCDAIKAFHKEWNDRADSVALRIAICQFTSHLFVVMSSVFLILLRD